MSKVNFRKRAYAAMERQSFSSCADSSCEADRAMSALINRDPGWTKLAEKFYWMEVEWEEMHNG